MELRNMSFTRKGIVYIILLINIIFVYELVDFILSYWVNELVPIVGEKDFFKNNNDKPLLILSITCYVLSEVYIIIMIQFKTTNFLKKRLLTGKNIINYDLLDKYKI